MQSRSIEDYPTESKQSQPGIATAKNDSRIGAHISIMAKMQLLGDLRRPLQLKTPKTAYNSLKSSHEIGKQRRALGSHNHIATLRKMSQKHMGELKPAENLDLE